MTHIWRLFLCEKSVKAWGLVRKKTKTPFNASFSKREIFTKNYAKITIYSSNLLLLSANLPFFITFVTHVKSFRIFGNFLDLISDFNFWFSDVKQILEPLRGDLTHFKNFHGGCITHGPIFRALLHRKSYRYIPNRPRVYSIICYIILKFYNLLNTVYLRLFSCQLPV